MKEKQKKIVKLVVQAGIVLVILITAIYLTKSVPNDSAIQAIVQAFGYPGLFIISIISGFNVFVPIPVIAFYSVFVQSGLHPFFTIFLISLGMTTGDVIGYFIGDTGRKITTSAVSQKSLTTITRLKERNPRLPLIVLGIYASIAPAPNELVIVPLGFLGYRLRYIFPIALIGNTFFNVLLAYGVMTLSFW